MFKKMGTNTIAQKKRFCLTTDVFFLLGTFAAQFGRGFVYALILRAVLVIQDNVRPPDQITGNADDFQPVVIVLVPLQVGVMPDLPDPQIRCQHLVPLILWVQVKALIYEEQAIVAPTIVALTLM